MPTCAGKMMALIKIKKMAVSGNETLVDILLEACRNIPYSILGSVLEEMNSQGHSLRLPDDSTQSDLASSTTGASARTAEGETGTADRYPMKANPRGKALIINNKHFLGQQEDRTDTDDDETALKELFQMLKFDVRLVHDLTASGIQKALHTIATEDHSQYDCVIVAMMSHGRTGPDGHGHICGTDGNLVQDVTVDFKTCQSLVGKPKLFFLEFCRGPTTDRGTEVHDSLDEPAAATALSEDDLAIFRPRYPVAADFLISYSTSSGSLSYRNLVSGSRYVQTLVDVFKTYVHQEHILEMLTTVSRRLANHPGAKKQISDVETRLTKKLYF